MERVCSGWSLGNVLEGRRPVLFLFVGWVELGGHPLEFCIGAWLWVLVREPVPEVRGHQPGQVVEADRIMGGI